MKNQILTLWKKKSKNDKVYYTGYISLGINGQAKVVAFPNYEKTDDKQPSLIGYLSEDNKEKPKQDTKPSEQDTANDDDIPF